MTKGVGDFGIDVFIWGAGGVMIGVFFVQPQQEVKMKGNYSDELDLLGKGKNVHISICNRDIFLHDFPTIMGIYFQVLVPDKNWHYTLERQGGNLYKRGFSPENQDVPDFVKQVSEWGGHRGRIYGKVLQRPNKEIACHLNKAAGFVRQGNIVAAIAAVRKVHGLGPSYGSKHLRMLCPLRCVAYDSVLMEKFSKRYGKSDCEGYAKFCALCVKLAKTLNGCYPTILNEERGGKWCAADIEAAIFCKYHKDTASIVKSTTGR